MCDADISLAYRIEMERDFNAALTKKGLEIDRDDPNSDLEILRLTSEAAISGMHFITGIDSNILSKRFDLSQLISYFNNILSPTLTSNPKELKREFVIAGEIWTLPETKVTAESKITFDEFILSKEITRQISYSGASYIESVPYIAAIFLRKKGEAFSKEMLSERGERLPFMRTLPLDIAKHCGLFFDMLNESLYNDFSVFGKAKGKQPNFAKHFDKWGWQSFLTFVAESGLFTIPGIGKNAIDCAKISLLYDVLSFTSERKDHDEIIASWQEAQR